MSHPESASSDPGMAVAVEPPQRRRRGPKALPLRTWLLVLMVLVSGIGLATSALAVSSIMRNVLYTLSLIHI